MDGRGKDMKRKVCVCDAKKRRKKADIAEQRGAASHFLFSLRSIMDQQPRVPRTRLAAPL